MGQFGKKTLGFLGQGQCLPNMSGTMAHLVKKMVGQLGLLGLFLFTTLPYQVGMLGGFLVTLAIVLVMITTTVTAVSMSSLMSVLPEGTQADGASAKLLAYLLFLPTTVAGAMYVLGAVEIGLMYLANDPEAMDLFGEGIADPINARVYGTLLLLTMACITMVGGDRFTNRLSYLAFACTLLAVVSLWAGAVMKVNGSAEGNICTVGNRLVRPVHNCTKDQDSDLHHKFCQAAVETNRKHFDCERYYLNNNARLRQGIKGLSSRVFHENLWLDSHSWAFGSTNQSTTSESNYLGGVKMDADMLFVQIITMFLTSCSGILPSLPQSNPAQSQKSKQVLLPAAVAALTALTASLASGLIYAGTVDPLLLRDRYGESIGSGNLVAGLIAWPSSKVFEVGALVGALGAGLHLLTAASQMLQALPKNPETSLLAKPPLAVGVTAAIAELAVLLGRVEDVAVVAALIFIYGFCAINGIRAYNFAGANKKCHWLKRVLASMGQVMSIYFMLRVMRHTHFCFIAIASGEAILFMIFASFFLGFSIT